MGLFYKIPLKKLYQDRNEILVKNGLPALKLNGFEKSPYQGTRFGQYDPGLYIYDLCRIKGNELHTITTYISRRDRWIKVNLNIFNLQPPAKSIDELVGLDGIQFHLPPNSITEMRLRVDDFKGIPLFRTIDHKVRSFYTEKGYNKRIADLSQLIEKDLSNIEDFVKRWHSLHQPLLTDWQGKVISK